MSRNSNEYVNVQGPAPAQDINMAGSTQGVGNEHAPGTPEWELANLRREHQAQAQQMIEMQNMVNQLMSQLMATPNEKVVKKPKMATPEKYDGNRNDLRTFLTTIDLYCEFNEVPSDQEKILMASTHMKGKAANWVQPYVEDYLSSIKTKGTKEETKALFASWNNFKDEMGRVFGEVDAKNQAEKAITRLKQTTSVSAYTAEFKQLQARIDWDDAALRTVFEDGLKEIVKDGLVHHDKPETLQALIELATRIDNRIWERNEQKKRQFRPNMANTKKQRNNRDKDGDTIMTGKVQEKTRDKKPRGKGQDGLSKEERQKRYDNKACLRCGEVGHFRRDCPKNEVKQAVVKIRMLKSQPSTLPSDDDLSDLDLYDEARLAENTDYVIVPELVRADKHMKWEPPQPSDWIVKDTDAQRRIAQNLCWMCGDPAHHGNGCPLRGRRIAVTGPMAREVLAQAAQEQPYFKDELPEPENDREDEHRKLHWIECDSIDYCEFHAEESRLSQYDAEECCHAHLRSEACKVLDCTIHAPWKQHDDHEMIAWNECKRRFCMFHSDAKEQCKLDEHDPNHKHLWANDCPMLDCHIHKEEHQRAHEQLCWINCIEKCRFHREQRIAARHADHHLHGTIAAKECRTIKCRMHGTKEINLPETLEEMIPHPNEHWTFCTDDNCRIHLDAKQNHGYFPRKRKGKKLGRVHYTDDRPKELVTTVYVQGHKLQAIVDSGAARTMISPRVVEKYEIPYRSKKRPLQVISAEETPVAYGKGTIRLETELVTLEVSDTKSQMSISIMDLGETDLLIGYDWLDAHNPAIDWRNRTILSREPAKRVAGVRHEIRPTNQCTTRDGRFGKISPHKIARIYAKDPQQVGVIWLRRVVPKKDRPLPQEKPKDVLLDIPKEYRTNEFKELFEENEATDLAEHQDWDHEIILEDGAKLTPGGMYPISPEHDAELKEYLRKNLKKGFIRPGSGPMASPILFVKKPNGKWRLCVDYRRLNAVTRKNRYPLPLITELMDRLQGAKWFTKFDVREGFYRIRIKEGDEWKTAFKTKYGLFEYTVMPFGLTNAPATFQSVINNALHEYLGVFATAYLDDVLVYSKGTLEEHIEHVKKVLRKLKEYKLYLQPGKCEFHTQETEFLGFIISTEGVKMNPKKVQAVRDWKTPKTVKDVQSFLGLANYYRKFIKDYSKITAPLTEITKKEVGFRWKQEQQKAFDKLKQTFLEAPVLEMYDPQRPTRLETDASDYALGAVLSQQCPDGKWRPVFYHSRKFDEAELNYDVHDKELLGVVDAFEQWEVYLLGLPHTIEVFTDHQNLTSFMTTKKLNRRQVRYAEMLAQFDFKITHRAGSLNGAADALSRRSDLRGKGHKEPHDAVLKRMPDGSLRYNQPDLARLAKIAEQVETLQQQWQQKANEWVPLDGQKELNGLQNKGEPRNESRPYVPTHMRKDLIKELHESREYGHASIDEMVRRLNKAFYMPRLRAQVQEVVGNCVACHQNKPKRHKPYGLLQPLPPPTRPWSSVTMDFIVKLPKSLEPGSARLCDTILVIMCRQTKGAKFVPTEETITAEECAYEVSKALISEHGMPEEFITDRDKLFTSKYWSTFLAKLGVKKKLSTSFHPETDGQTERTNQTLEQYLRFYANKLQDNWVELLPTAQLAYNSSRSATTKYSPHYANYGYEPVAHRDPKDIESIAVGADDKARLMRELHKELSRNIAHRNLTTSKAANKLRIEGPTFKKGDRVFLSRQNLKTKRPSKKLDNLRLGPFEILEKMGPVNYKLRLPPGMRIHNVFHKKLLEPAPPEAELMDDIELEDDEYTVEEIKDLQKIGGQWKYLVRWEGWPDSHNTWEPEGNLTNCRSLVREYHRKHPRKRGTDPRGKGNNQVKKGRKKRQPVTSPSQSTVRVAMVRLSDGPYQGRSSPRPALAHDPEGSRWHDLDQQILALAPQPLGARAEVAQSPSQPEAGAPQHEQSRDAFAASQPRPSPTLPQKQKGYTQRKPKYNQRSDQMLCPRNNEDSSLHNVYTEKSSRGLVPLYGQRGPDAEESNSGYGHDELVEPWAWLGRHGGRSAYDTTGIPRYLSKPPAPSDARENDNPGYRDDNPKRGDNVTSNKEGSLLDDGRR
ncbi:Reverse Transcriptase [Curvularia clavata]|uniref:Reverse Transcriptase n=2 Tax=Curvularia clavata TaxID=95742 RepID=A0A9Q9DPG4_CURCL|nr:Reverse Transcriptase [Curvularia clavata]USP73991.1 Reverse Transcriptase [Curvularia clavata]USP76442.1 Reverse Transcriptase [Curvularia clavata]USP77971.1 Reverse Transcriptase [Curvularia clavata]USP77990.1 Reverse Transcriptase [Curvularia clavata]